MILYLNNKNQLRIQPRSRALEPGLIRLFFYPEQYFSLTDSSSIPPNHSNSSEIQTSEHALYFRKPFLIPWKTKRAPDPLSPARGATTRGKPAQQAAQGGEPARAGNLAKRPPDTRRTTWRNAPLFQQRRGLHSAPYKDSSLQRACPRARRPTAGLPGGRKGSNT